MSCDPSVCKRCALEGPTCCQLMPGQEELCFPLSSLEKERIQEFAPDEGGFALQENTEEFIVFLNRIFPGEEKTLRELFRPRTFHYRLAVDAKGSCTFLGPEGCRIPTELRPYYCRIFPFWIAGEDVTIFDAPSCLARREAVHILRILEALGTTSAKVRDLMGRLRLAWGLPPTTGMRRVKRRF